LVTALNETFGYESVTLLLVDHGANELVVREAYGLRKDRHLGFRIPITTGSEGGIVGYVAAEGGSLLVPDVLASERYIRTVEETRSELAVPLRIKEQVIGVLDIQSTAIHGITEKDRYIIEALADQVAIALENARLYDDLARANAKIRRQAHDLRQLLQRTVRIQEQERHRIAADIHDDVNQWLYAAMYETEAALQSLPQTDAVRDSLQQVQSSLDQALVDMRKAIFDLWPTSLDEMGLLPSIQSSLNRLEKAYGLKCKLKIQGTPIKFAPLARITIYRIVQEALQNAAKHARARTVTVSFVFSDAQVVLRIEDDGRGFGRRKPSRSGGGHLGLISMQERARSLGGRSRFASGKGRGASLVFEFPMAMVSRNGGGAEGMDSD
jgi:signal transduction histidine kinase